MEGSWLSPLTLLTDPILRGPALGALLMCATTSLVGVVVLLQRRSLIGEALSHACYPGIVLAALLFSAIPSFAYQPDAPIVSVAIFAGALLFSGLALASIDLLERRWHFSSDAALTAVLALFFGLGVLLTSHLQASHPLWVQQVQIFLYGQPATLTDDHLLLYLVLTATVALLLFLFHQPLRALLFDREFALSVGLPVRALDRGIALLIAMAIMVGMRTIGVVLMSGMLVAPPLAARLLHKKLSKIVVSAVVIGSLSALLGSYASFVLPQLLTPVGARPFSLPSGPVILLVATSFCMAVLLFSGRSGLVQRIWRRRKYAAQIAVENGLKAIWRDYGTDLFSEGEWHHIAILFLGPARWKSKHLLRRMCREGWIEPLGAERCYKLTSDGEKRARRIVRLHRLWEVYLVNVVGQRKERVHQSAEEMEHVLTPELEQMLAGLLGDPKRDPHSQPIPS